MKVLILSDAQSVHTKRWVSSLKERGLDIVLYSIKPAIDDYFDQLKIKSYYFDLFTYKGKGGLLASFRRHKEAVADLKKVIIEEHPDILHSHFVTSYSLIAALSGFHPLVVSVWGSDIYDFPNRSFINRISVKYILRKADKILSTSHIMALETRKYTSKDISVTPFGVDVSLFNKKDVFKDTSSFTIGTVKTLSYKYGIDYLIKAFKVVCDSNPDVNMVLEIVGTGKDEAMLREIAEKSGIADKVYFDGYVDNSEVYQCYNRFDIAVFLSLEESFGVAAVEAMACECPVVTSDADGFTEVVENGVTGIIVPRKDIKAAAAAIQKLIDDKSLLSSFGKAGRKRVCSLYDWKSNVSTMIDIYQSILSGKNE